MPDSAETTAQLVQPITATPVASKEAQAPLTSTEKPLEPAKQTKEAQPKTHNNPSISSAVGEKHSTTRVLRIEMKGFKSFASKVEIPLGEHYNCIIGPNGSGKSNILDALCFVLGKAGAKSMRVEKTSNLIYNGGKTKNPAKEGEVSLYLDNTLKTFPMDVKEVKISRIIKPNGTSVYKMNDEVCTRNQIYELLMFAHIDPDGYNIILQGDITGLIKMSSEERRMIIDEISGIGEYEDRRHKAELELNKVDTQLKEGDIILAERGTYMKELKKERDQAQKFKDLEEKLKRNKATIVWRKIDERADKESKLAKQLADEEGKISVVQTKINEHKTDIASKKQRTNEINKEIQSKGQKEQLELNKQVEQLKVDIAIAGNRIETLKSELSRLKERKEQLQKQESETRTRVDGIDKDITNKIAREQAIQSELKQLQEKIAAVRKKHNLEDASAVDDKIAALDKEIDALQEETGKLRAEEQTLLRERDKLEYQLGTIDGAIQKVLELESKNKEQVTELKRDKEALVKAQRELKDTLEQAKSLTAEYQHSEAKLHTKEDELSKLRSRNIQIREAASGNMAIQKILEQKNKIKGIHGTIAELGSVKEEHSLALEVAAGGRIRSIVVEDDKVAQECIQFLKEHKLGVATFLPLNKVKGAGGTPPTHKSVVGLAIDLVTFDKKYANAFQYVFGSTVVVEDIAAARTIGIGSYRMVTVSGDLVETSGAMSGGFLQRGKQGMGFQEKELTDQLAKLEQEIADLETVEAALRLKRDKNGEHIEELRKQVGELEANVIKLERILKIDSSDTGASKEQKNQLQHAVTEVEKKLDHVQERVREITVRMGVAKTDKQKHRDSLTQLRNPAVLAEIQAIENQRASLDSERITIKAQADSIKAQRDSVHKPELENITKIFKQQAQEETKFSAELEKLTAKKTENEATLKEKDKEAAAFYKQFQKLFDERDALQEAITKIEGKVIEEEEKIRKNEQQRGSIQIGLAGVRAELAGLNEENKQFEGVEPFKTKDMHEIEKEIKDFERMMQDLGAINMKALEIYETAQKEYVELNAKKEILNKEREQVLVMINEVDLKKKDLFLKMFTMINEQFKKIFLQLNTKGEAFLELENPEDPLNAGMNIKVRLTGNKFLDINSLSGGEKTMTALAFLFAIQEHEPAQFYVLDEIDAALDKRNAEKLAMLVREYCSKAQYILISHNDAVITEADQIYGVSMNEHYMHSVEWELVPKAITNVALQQLVPGFVKWFVRRQYQKCDLLLVPSESMSELLLWNKIHTPRQIVHLGVDAKAFSPPKDKGAAKVTLGLPKDSLIIGYHGRLAPEKDLKTLLRGFMRVKGATLLVVGAGTPEITKSLERKDVILVGAKDNVVPYLQAMDIYVLTSLTETTSLSVLEAMSCGLPVISTPVGFVRDYIETGVNGVLIPRQDAFSLSKELEKLQASQLLRDKLGGNARRTVESRFTWDKTRKRIKEIFEGL